MGFKRIDVEETALYAKKFVRYEEGARKYSMGLSKFQALSREAKHHHGKEEKILFRHMLEKLGPVAEKLVRNGMLSILSTHSCISCTACTSRCLFTLKTKHFLIHSFLSYCRFCGLIIIVTMLLSLFNFSSHLQLQFYCCIHHSYVAVTT